jgi:hypothetical protein
MKKVVIVIFALIFWNANVFAKEEIRSRFGFYITIPSNFIAIQDQNFEELLKKYKGSNIDKDAFKKSMGGVISRDIEYFFSHDIEDPEKHSINIMVRKGDIKGINSSNIRDLCSGVKNEISKITGKNLQQYACELTNKFSPKFQPAIFIYQDGLSNTKFQIQYQIATNAGITTFTAGCNTTRTCDLMNNHVSEMIRSIR